MKKILLSFILLLIILCSILLLYNLNYSEEEIEIDNGGELKDTKIEIIDEISDELLEEDGEIEIGEII